MFFFNQQPMTPDQIAQTRRRMDGLRHSMAFSPPPQNIGAGLAQLGQGIAYGVMRNRINSQFPEAPAAPGVEMAGNAQPQQNSPMVRQIAEALMGNKAPWQFPAAPADPAGMQPASPSSPPPGGLFGFSPFKQEPPGGLW